MGIWLRLGTCTYHKFLEFNSPFCSRHQLPAKVHAWGQQVMTQYMVPCHHMEDADNATGYPASVICEWMCVYIYVCLCVSMPQIHEDVYIKYKIKNSNKYFLKTSEENYISKLNPEIKKNSIFFSFFLIWTWKCYHS